MLIDIFLQNPLLISLLYMQVVLDLLVIMLLSFFLLDWTCRLEHIVAVPSYFRSCLLTY